MKIILHMEPVHVLRWYFFAYAKRQEFEFVILIACVIQNIIFDMINDKVV